MIIICFAPFHFSIFKNRRSIALENGFRPETCFQILSSFSGDLRFFSGDLTQLRIRILRLPGIEVAGKTGKLSRYVSAVLVLAAPHWLTCQGEQAALLPRGFSGALTQLRICILREPGIEAA